MTAGLLTAIAPPLPAGAVFDETKDETMSTAAMGSDVKFNVDDTEMERAPPSAVDAVLPEAAIPASTTVPPGWRLSERAPEEVAEQPVKVVEDMKKDGSDGEAAANARLRVELRRSGFSESLADCEAPGRIALSTSSEQPPSTGAEMFGEERAPCRPWGGRLIQAPPPSPIGELQPEKVALVTTAQPVTLAHRQPPAPVPAVPLIIEQLASWRSCTALPYTAAPAP